MDILDKMRMEEFSKDKESLLLMAQGLKALYDAYIEAGFTKDEALTLLVETLK